MKTTITKLVYREEKGVRIHTVLKFKPGHPDYEKELAAREEWVKEQQQLKVTTSLPLPSVLKK